MERCSSTSKNPLLIPNPFYKSLLRRTKSEISTIFLALFRVFASPFFQSRSPPDTQKQFAVIAEKTDLILIIDGSYLEPNHPQLGEGKDKKPIIAFRDEKKSTALLQAFILNEPASARYV
ncbi:hypothetical protein AVEN_213230-1 [Araneus ventricosus]|uniref:Uncharacterized protein n=1 Tax=Araneus ventricosus TaxID=182803 RepID=A0A4Y2JPR3_ARAVE|nr:hypothetical protein AVEN_213230-1 [Araneus ventricosus]